MFGIGLPELILIMAVALIVVGPEKLPELAKSLAKGVLELKKAAATLKESLHEDEDQQDTPPLISDSDKLPNLEAPQPPSQDSTPETPAESVSAEENGDSSDKTSNIGKEGEEDTTP